MGLNGFCFVAIDSRSGTPNIPFWHLGMILGPSLDVGFHGFCFAAIDSRSCIPNIPLGHNGDDSGPSVGDTGLHGFCFAAIDSRSGTPSIPLGLNGMILGPSHTTRVFTGSVFLPSIPDLAHQRSRWGSTG